MINWYTMEHLAGADHGANAHVFSWYQDGTVAEGTSSNLDHYSALGKFS